MNPTPSERTFSVRGASAACHVNARLIRRKLAGGALPGARRLPSGEWTIPAADLERAGLEPARASTEVACIDPIGQNGVLVLEASPDSAPVARLCVQLVGAAIVQTERMRAELDKWQTVAEERARSLDRADVALQTIARAVQVSASVTEAAVASSGRFGRVVPSALPPVPPPPLIAAWDGHTNGRRELGRPRGRFVRRSGLVRVLGRESVAAG